MSHTERNFHRKSCSIDLCGYAENQSEGATGENNEEMLIDMVIMLGLGVQIDVNHNKMMDIDQTAQKDHVPCTNCNDWGYIKIPVPCNCYHTGITYICAHTKFIL